jgi:hypothetical protein
MYDMSYQSKQAVVSKVGLFVQAVGRARHTLVKVSVFLKFFNKESLVRTVLLSWNDKLGQQLVIYSDCLLGPSYVMLLTFLWQQGGREKWERGIGS